ncbi:MAG TPA: LLM class flavin-dependent oxidoreductase [Gammaproteobacteria bacterium]|nr:LLM class flavin-dependent oxidoreductase [Gammaproteobacteria bacterium]
MRFVSFNLMPYRDLPADFEQTYPSVWVSPPRTLYDPRIGHQTYHDYLDALEYSIDLGYDGVGVNEHHSNAYGLMPSPNLLASILSRKIRHSDTTSLMVLGNSLALYNPPIRVAEEFAMLDVLSGGKFIAGFPVGTSMDSNYVYGINPSELRERYYEAHDLVIKAWKSEEMFTWNGKYNQLRYVNTWPRTAQTPHPPVWIPGGGSVETYDFALENDYSFSYLSFFGHQYAKKVMTPFWQRAEALGKDNNPYRAGYCQLVCVAETDEIAEKEYAEHAMYFFAKCMHIDPKFIEAPGYRTVASLKAGLRSQLDGSAKFGSALAQEGLGWKDFVERGYIIAGSPDTVAEKLREAAVELHVGNIILINQVGSMPVGLLRKNLQMFAEEVMPKLRDLWPEWDHSHYWPSGFEEQYSTPETAGSAAAGGA